MKRLFLAVLSIFAFVNLNAQEDGTPGFAKGDVFVSGSIGFNTASQADEKQNDFNFSPSVGYFFTENIAGEFSLIIGSSTFEVGEFEDKSSDFGASLGATYFFTPANRFSFSIGAGFAYVSSKFEESGFGSDNETTVNTFGFVVAPGVNYFVSNNFALRASVGALSYTSSKADFDGAEALNTFGLNLDLSDINFGILYKF